ncbi:hypothetical protein FD04_GL000804 [Secundilactobacillus odoratitofui DSM 19909 = JCM 15043]|uniref:Mga helix-turn-helix domain-containing protein n=1 Tax=Secundilactobacillus odoratitofui DSM 19909 = JCM 15043 TaxID=1423776 RepID=A0A0R1LQV3_9LACO|nr:hypothetical protein [Secundilactobacillus odoratitofui]KRK97832.1 hypothetical protein FD04_GL000804 [Secundilactobacillus odoratitofui DSM 19909 = JCM 15043]
MNYNYLFSKNDATCFDILTMLNTRSDMRISKHELNEQFDLTNYQLHKFFNSINADLMQVSGNEPAYLDESDNLHWQAFQVDTLLIQRVALLYLNRSPLYVALEYNFFYDNLYTQKEYVSANYMSTSVFYRASENLEKTLNAHHFYTASTLFADDEFTTRLHLFQLYYTVYNTVEVPFADLTNLVDRLIEVISTILPKQLKPTQLTKLSIFLRVWLLRMNNHHILENVIFDSLNPDQSGKELYSLIDDILVKGIKFNEAEFNYLYAFLLTQGFLGESLQSGAATSLPTVVQLSNQFIHNILHQNILVQTSLINSDALWQRILNIHLQFMTFFIEPTTFINPNQINFFSELYPAFDISIHQTIDELKQRRDLKIDQHMSVNLYFSYMFALINSIPPELMKDQVHICVDFSQGTLYTDYVIASLQSFSHANIILDVLVTNKTDIYISDFHSPQVHKQQVVWQDPPTSLDWTKLADIILSVKKRKLSGVIPKESDGSETN